MIESTYTSAYRPLNRKLNKYDITVWCPSAYHNTNMSMFVSNCNFMSGNGYQSMCVYNSSTAYTHMSTDMSKIISPTINTCDDLFTIQDAARNLFSITTTSYDQFPLESIIIRIDRADHMYDKWTRVLAATE